MLLSGFGASGPSAVCRGLLPQAPQPHCMTPGVLLAAVSGLAGGQGVCREPQGALGHRAVLPRASTGTSTQNCFSQSQSRSEPGAGGMAAGAGRKTRGLQTFVRTPRSAEVLQISDPSPHPPVGFALRSLLPRPGAVSQMLLAVADLVRTIASRASQMTRFYL